MRFDNGRLRVRYHVEKVLSDAYRVVLWILCPVRVLREESVACGQSPQDDAHPVPGDENIKSLNVIQNGRCNVDTVKLSLCRFEGTVLNGFLRNGAR